MTLSVAASAEELPHHRIDGRELYSLLKATPDAASLIERGEEKLRAGDVKAAGELFAHALALAPTSALAARRRCQAMALLDRKADALSACQRALDNGGSPLDQRAAVLALMSGAEPPTTQDLADAALFAATARRRLADEPWGYAAQCDILARIGDRSAVEACAERVRTFDPEHYEARRALSRVRGPGSALWLALGWGAIGLAAIGTLAHALLRRASPLRRSGATLGAGLMLALLASPARADQDASAATPPASSAPAAEDGAPGLSKWKLNDADPMKSVPTPAQRDADPMEYGYFLIELTNRAGAAEERKDYPAALRYYQALVKAVPDEAIGFSKVCQMAETLGQRQDALDACTIALTLRGSTLGDYARYGNLLVAKDGTFTRADATNLRRVILHLRGEREGHALADELECPLGLRTRETAILERCMNQFVRADAHSQQSALYGWAWAISRGDVEGASRFLDQAKSAKLSPVGLREMEQKTSEARMARYKSWFLTWKVGGVALLVALAALGLAIGRVMLRRARPAT